jgi:hypothetical protein
MSNILWILFSIIAYVGGLAIMWRTTPQILVRSYDEGMFMVIAAVDIIGAILAFAAAVIIYALTPAPTVAEKVVDAILLLGILFVSLRLSIFSFRPSPYLHANRVSSILSGFFCVFLAIASLYYLVSIVFQPS